MTVPNANSFTVAAVTSQASTDSFSLFVAKTVGVEGFDEETSFEYMSNFNEKSIRNSSTEATVVAGQFLLFTYNEVIPIFVQVTNNVSSTLMKTTLGYTDGIFEGQPIVDRTLTSREETIKTAQAILQKYSNVIIKATFRTNQEGLESGQLLRITDTGSTERNIDQDFVILSVKMKQVEWGENEYSVTCSSLLFGMLELLQQILASGRKIKIDEDEVVNNIEDQYEIITVSDVFSGQID